MPLPDSGEDLLWPPKEFGGVYQRYEEHSAWYSGDVNMLSAFYAQGLVRSHRDGSPPGGGAPPGMLDATYAGFFRINFDRFWARTTAAPSRRLMLHIPIAADVSTASADLLFSDPPKPTIEEAHGPHASNDAKVVQDRIDQVFVDAGVGAVLTEAAETGSALGGSFLRVTWDKDVEERHPILTAVDADRAVPEFRWSLLMAVTFWQVVEVKDSGMSGEGVWRHLERHEPGFILHGLYRGTQTHLGTRMPLALLGDEWISEDQAPTMDVVETGIPWITAVYIPNMKPNRVWRGSNLGRSDYDGIEPMLDSLDECWTSWMRDLRLGRARIMVPSEYLDAQGPGRGAGFDLDQEVFEKLPMAVARDEGAITPHQFQIRAADHMATAQALLERIVAAAGYSSTTFGLEEVQRGVTATEIISRERRSYVTREKKIRYWRDPLSHILRVLIALDTVQGYSQHEIFKPRVDFPEAVQEDPGKISAAVVTLRQAMAASTHTLVKMTHDTWTPEEVDAEVLAIYDEQKLLHVQSGGPTNPAGEARGVHSTRTPGDTSSTTPTIRRAGEGLPPGATQGGPE